MKVYLYVKGHEMHTIHKDVEMVEGYEFFVIEGCGTMCSTYRVTLIDSHSAIAERVKVSMGDRDYYEETVLG